MYIKIFKIDDGGTDIKKKNSIYFLMAYKIANESERGVHCTCNGKD